MSPEAGHQDVHACKTYDEQVSRRFRFSVIITSLIFFAELVGGYLTNSLALLSDSAHVFMDVFALFLSWLAIYLSTKPSTKWNTYGFHRAEVFVSVINGTTLLFISFGIFIEAYERFLNPEEVKSLAMLLVAVIGFAVNVIVALKIRDFSHDDLNIKSAYFHVIGDAIASLGVIISGIIMHYTGFYKLDAIMSFFIATIVISGSLRILKESVHILLEGVPRGIDVNKVAEDMSKVEGVKSVHKLHIWSICSNISALSAHIDTSTDDKAERQRILKEINERLVNKFHICHSTLQFECVDCMAPDVVQSIKHRERKNNHTRHGHHH
jgi:cobalt-zinc-cadmium efflux system protein